MTLFDWIKEITVTKTPVENFSEESWDSFNSYMISRYLSMDMGVGAEKMISPRTSIFAQSSYQSFVGHISKGIGPYNDRISTVSFQSGVRINLFEPIKN